jgi:hypothetical protein
MCITTTNALPSRNPCSLCVLDNEEVTYRAWDQALRDASLDGGIFRDLCDEHKEEVEEWEEAEEHSDTFDPNPDHPEYDDMVDEDDGGPDGPPVDEDGEAFYEDDWADGNDLHGYMGEEGY